MSDFADRMSNVVDRTQLERYTPIRLSNASVVSCPETLDHVIEKLLASPTDASERSITIDSSLTSRMGNLIAISKRNPILGRRIDVPDWKRAGGVWHVALTIASNDNTAGVMDRKALIQHFVFQLNESEKTPLTVQQKEFVALEVDAAIERALRRSLPTRAELEERNALYANRPNDPETGRPQSIIQFLETGWPAQFIANGILTRPDFRRLDPQAEQALRNWIRERRAQPPAHLHIPTLSEAIDRELQEGPERLKAARRVARAHDRRAARPTER